MKIITLLLLFYGQSLWATDQSSKVGCSHVQVCNLLHSLRGEAGNWQIQPILAQGQIDPHHFRPSISSIKKMLSLKYFVFAPLQIENWSKSVLTKRRARQLKSLALNIGSDRSNLANNSKAHFWLDPHTSCEQRNRIADFLKQQKLSVKAAACPDYKQLSSRYLRLKEKLAQTTVLISHDSLYNFFLHLYLTPITLKHSHHHSGVSSKLLKRIRKLQKSGQSILWIDEAVISGLEGLAKHMRPKRDKILKINSLGEYPQSPLFVLTKIIEALEAI